MSVDAITTFLSLLALIALAGAVVALLAGTGARAHTSTGVTLRRSALGLAATVAVVALAGSLYLSEGAHFLPCRLCWYQRIAMYALAVILVVAALRRDAGVRWYALPLAAGGFAISLWHLGVEHLGIGEGACELTNPCSIRWVEHFGFVTIPFMAACGFVAIAVLTAIADPYAVEDDGASDADSPSTTGGAPVMEGSGR